MALEGQGSNV